MEDYPVEISRPGVPSDALLREVHCGNYGYPNTNDYQSRPVSP